MPESTWDQLCDLIEQAESLPASDQLAFLQSACGANAALLREAIALLAVSNIPADFLPPPTDSAVDVTPEPPALERGLILADRFCIEAFIGRGGMGEVYRAFDQELQESIALKTIRNSLATPAMVERFKTEIQLARRITHANVCRIFDLSKHPSNPPLHFLTMEFLPGESLYERTRSHRFTKNESIEIICQLLSALDAAHSLGIVHRDIKPSNIMMVPLDGGRHRAVLMDFGLAASFSKSPSQDPLLAGTPQYMAPEQAQSNAATPASDIYSLGVLLHDLITGARPQGIESLTELANASPNAPAPAVAFRELDPATARILLRCLQPDPKARYQSCAEMLAALLHKPWVTPRRAAVATLIFGSLAAAGYSLWPRQPVGRVSAIDEANALYQKGRLHARRLNTSDITKAIAYFDQSIRLDPSFALAHSARADAFSNLTDYGGTNQRDAARQAVASARQAVALGPALPEAHSSLGVALSCDLPRWRDAAPSFQEALRLDSRYGPAHQGIAVFNIRLGKLSLARDHMTQAAALDPVNLPTSVTRGFVDYFARNYKASIQQALRTTDLDPNFRYGYLLLARSYTETGQLDQALEACETGIRLSGNAPVFLSAKSAIFIRLRQFQDARQLLAQLIARQPSEHIPALYIASIHCRLGEFDQCYRWLHAGWNNWESSILLMSVYPHFDAIRQSANYRKLESLFLLT
jgi:serine/threonine protein kinase